MDQMDTKNYMGIVSDKKFGNLLEKMLNVRLGFIGGKVIVPAAGYQREL
jgi:hypothetical protein